MNNHIWNKIVSSYSQNPRDVITTPQGNRKGRWFNVYVDSNKVYIATAKDHAYSSKLAMDRPLSSSECERVYALHIKRKQGLLIRGEVADASQNSSYWFGIFDDLGL